MNSSIDKQKPHQAVLDIAGVKMRERDLNAARFIDAVVREIRKVVDTKKSEGTTLSDIAQCMNVDKGQLSRQLKGSSNMTLRTIGEISWALGRKPVFSLEIRPADQNHFVTQASTSTVDTGSDEVALPQEDTVGSARKKPMQRYNYLGAFRVSESNIETA